MSKHQAQIALLFCLTLTGKTLAEEKPLPGDMASWFKPPSALKDDRGHYRSVLTYQGKAIKDATPWQKKRAEILRTWHRLLGPWPPLVKKPRIERLSTKKRGNLTQHAIRLEVAPGRFTTDAYLLMPLGKGPFPAVVVVFYDAKTGIGMGKPYRDFALQMAKRGFVALSLGSAPETYYPSREKVQLQPLSFHAYVAANCHTALAQLPEVDPKRIGIVGHSYGGKWALFASCLYEKFACAVWSDPGIVFDEKRANVNYWDPWYLGYDPKEKRKRGLPSKTNPRVGPYKTLIQNGHDLHELHALMAPRPFLVSGGSEDPPARWKALNHSIAVNRLLGFENRVAMTNRKGHSPTEASNEQIYRFFEHFLKKGADRKAP